MHANYQEGACPPLLMRLQACTEWFVRLRPSLLKLSAALAHHSATAQHGLKHLEMLPRQIKAALAPAPIPIPTTTQQAVSARSATGVSVATHEQPKPAKSQQRQAVPVRALEPPRILRRSMVSNVGESAPGIGQPCQSTLQPTHSEEQRSQPNTVSRSPQHEEAHAQPLTAREKLLREILDTLWLVCSALAELGQPDDIAGMHATASSAVSKLSDVALR